METDKKENKYYVPSIEEFHVGFEFESYRRSYDILFGGEDTYYWVENTLTDSIDLQLINNAIEKKRVRVKYLDKKDIESLRWRLKEPEKTIYVWDKYKKGGNEILLQYDSDTKKLIITGVVYNRHNRQLFEGFIKNKSELVRLMKQLGIE